MSASRNTSPSATWIFQVAVFFLYCNTGAHAQDPRFTASAGKTKLVQGEQFEVTYTIEERGNNFRPPAFRDFNILSGPNQSTSMQFINGSMSQSVSYSYVLLAFKEGTFTLPPASIEVNGKKLFSNSLAIEVSKGNSRQNQGNNQKNPSTQDEGDLNTQIGNNLQIRVAVNKTHVVRGEALVATFRLVTKVNLVNYGISKMPSLSGFWSQDIEMPKQLQLHRETIDGVTYSVADIRKVVLFPQHSGTLEIDPMEGEFVVRAEKKRKRSNDLFDQFFNDPFFGNPFGGYQDVNFKTSSSPLKIVVSDLPGNAPPSFKGAVGKYTMESHLDKSSVKTNEPVSLKIKISGSGNLKLLENPQIFFPPDIESYDPRISDNISVSAAGVNGSRTFEYLLIPRHAGDYKIAPLGFSYYDTEKKQYLTLTSPEFILKVDKGDGSESPGIVNGVNKEDLKLLGKDIRYIKTGMIRERRKGDFFYGSPGFYAAMASPPVMLTIFLLAYRKNRKLKSNMAALKSKWANRIARKRLASAKKFLAQDKKELFYEEISKALWGYLSDRLNIPVSSLSKESAVAWLTEKNINPEMITKLSETIDECEFSRFAPGAESGMNTMYANTIALITGIETGINS